MLFLRLNQALQLLRACKTQRETLIIRYAMLNGLSNMEIAYGRIEHLDPVEYTLFLPKRHWKRNCLTTIDPETVQHQIVYSGPRKRGPLIRSQMNGHLTPMWIWGITKKVAQRTTIPDKGKINPLILKRTFAKNWLERGGTVGSLQKQFSHKHLSSTAHYLRFDLRDARRDHKRMMEPFKDVKTKFARLVS